MLHYTKCLPLHNFLHIVAYWCICSHTVHHDSYKLFQPDSTSWMIIITHLWSIITLSSWSILTTIFYLIFTVHRYSILNTPCCLCITVSKLYILLAYILSILTIHHYCTPQINHNYFHLIDTSFSPCLINTASFWSILIAYFYYILIFFLVNHYLFC